jgi:hypothetical protein
LIDLASDCLFAPTRSTRTEHDGQTRLTLLLRGFLFGAIVLAVSESIDRLLQWHVSNHFWEPSHVLNPIALDSDWSCLAYDPSARCYHSINRDHCCIWWEQSSSYALTRSNSLQFIPFWVFVLGYTCPSETACTHVVHYCTSMCIGRCVATLQSEAVLWPSTAVEVRTQKPHCSVLRRPHFASRQCAIPGTPYSISTVCTGFVSCPDHSHRDRSLKWQSLISTTTATTTTIKFAACCSPSSFNAKHLYLLWYLRRSIASRFYLVLSRCW